MRAGLAATLLATLLWAPAALAAGGDPLWDDVQDVASGSDDVARAVAVAGRRVVVAGVTDSLGNVDAVVRAYDGKTGAPLWADGFGSVGVVDEINAAAARGRRVFVAGQTRAVGAISEAFTVRAYDARTGAMLWQDLKDLTGGVERAVALTAAGKAVYGLVGLGTGLEAEVIAYQAKGGARLWSDRSDFGGATVAPRAIAVAGRRLAVAAEVENPTGDMDFLVRIYDAKHGGLRFQHRVDAAAGDEEARAVAVAGKRVYGGGALRSAADQLDFAVRAYDAKTGLPLWEDSLDGGAGQDDRVLALAASGTRVFAVGSLTGGSVDFAVRAYDGRSGALLWSDRHDPEGGTDVAEAVTVAGSSVVVAGRSQNANGDEDFLVRSYRAASGVLEFEHRFDAAAGFDAAHAAAVRGKRLFAVGEAESSGGDADLVVRGLSAR